MMDDDDGLPACEIDWEKAYQSIYKKGCVYLPSLSRMSASIRIGLLVMFSRNEASILISSHLISLSSLPMPATSRHSHRA